LSEETKREHRTRRDWEKAVEKQIREAMERGDFDHLPGKGKPLDLDSNPFTPSDWQMAYKILKDAGMAPEWIELDKEIRRERDALMSWFSQQAEWQRKQIANARTLPADKTIAERARLASVREQTCEKFRQRANILNKMIDTFNLKAPRADLHHARIRVDKEIQTFNDACSG
jgi:DnaJ family protein C protein 28